MASTPPVDRSPWLGLRRNHGMGGRVLRNASWRLSANVLALGISAIAFPLIARRLGSDGYGQLAVVTGFTGLIGQLVGLRLWEVVIKYLAEALARQDAARAWAVVRLAYVLDVSTALLILLGLVAAAPLAAERLLHAPALSGLFVLAGLHASAGTTSSVSTATLRVFDRFRFLASADIAMTILRTAVVLGLVLTGGGVTGALVGYTASQAASSALLFWQAIRLLRTRAAQPLWGPIVEPLRGRLREIAGMLFNLNFDTYRKAITANADTVILGYFAPASTVGVYKVARQLAGYVGQLGNPLYETVYPEIAREWDAGGRAPVLKLLRRVSVGVALALAGVWGVSWLAAAPIIRLLLGPEFDGAAPLFLILLGTNIWLLLLWAPGLMYTTGRSRTHVLINLGSACFSLLAMLALAPRFGAVGVAVGVLAQQAAWTIILAVYLWTRRATLLAAS